MLRQGEDKTVDFKLGRFDDDRRWPRTRPATSTTRAPSSERLGATLAPMTPTAREQLGLDDDVDGVVITSLDGNGRAADAGLEVGDVILTVGDTAGADARATSSRRCTPPRPTRC